MSLEKKRLVSLPSTFREQADMLKQSEGYIEGDTWKEPCRRCVETDDLKERYEAHLACDPDDSLLDSVLDLSFLDLGDPIEMKATP